MTARRGTSTFVGREADLDALERSLASGTRLITLLGPSGVGKTRLSLEVLARLCGGASDHAFDHGCFCDLSDAHDESDVYRALARSLGISMHEELAGDLASLSGLLGVRGPCVYVLDNAEQVRQAVQQAVGLWMSGAPQACFIVTSRERLGLEEELIHELGPLTVPADATSASESAPGRLFLECAHRVAPRLEIDDASLRNVIDAVEGFPLALEIVAGWMNTLNPSQIVERIATADLSARHDTAGRHQSMERALASSWDLLSSHEREVLGDLTVFRGGFGIEAAEAVARPSPGGPAVLEVVQSLREKSLLQVYADPFCTDRVRLRPYASVLRLAAERMAERRPDAARRHAEHYLSEAAEDANEVELRGGGAALARLLSERDNLHAIFDATHDVDITLRARAVLCTHPIAIREGPLATHRKALEEVLREGETTLAEPTRIDLRLALAACCHALGDAKNALRHCARALEQAEGLDDSRRQARILRTRAVSEIERGDLDAAEASLEQSLSLSAELMDGSGEGLALLRLGQLEQLRGRAQAVEHLEEAARILHAQGNVRHAAISQRILGLIALDAGDTVSARRLLELARARLEAPRTLLDDAEILGPLGHIAHLEGRLDAAEHLYLETVASHRDLGRAGDVAKWLTFVGWVQIDLHRPRTRETLDEARASGPDRATAILLDALTAFQTARQGNAEAARTMFTRLRGRLDDASPPLRTTVELLETFLDPAPPAPSLPDGATGSRVGIGARLAEASLRRATDDAATDVDDAEALRVGVDARWFEIGGERYGFRRQAAQRRLLLRLVEARLDAPGTALSMDVLFSAGWPGESIREESVKNRVYVSLSRLRKLGLANAIVARDDGWLIDPDLTVVANVVDGLPT